MGASAGGWVSLYVGVPMGGCPCVRAAVHVNIHISWSCCVRGRLGVCVGTRAVPIWDTDSQEGEGTGDSPCPLHHLPGWGVGVSGGSGSPGTCLGNKWPVCPWGAVSCRCPSRMGGHPSYGIEGLSPTGDARQRGPARGHCWGEEALSYFWVSVMTTWGQREGETVPPRPGHFDPKVPKMEACAAATGFKDIRPPQLGPSAAWGQGQEEAHPQGVGGTCCGSHDPMSVPVPSVPLTHRASPWAHVCVPAHTG